MSGLRVRTVSVGRPRTPGLRAAIDHYEDRLTHYFRFDSVEVPAAGLDDAQADRARETEAARLAGHRLPDARVFALTREGRRLDTRSLASMLGDQTNYGPGAAAFLIGGAHGIESSLLARADVRMSLSALTLPHELARLVLVEQLYRAGTLLRGEAYHKGG